MLNSQFSSEPRELLSLGWELRIGDWSDCRHVPDNMRGCIALQLVFVLRDMLPAQISQKV